MGIFDGAQICTIFSLYLFDILWSLIGRENERLYRDGGFAAINSSRGPALYKMTKIFTYDNDLYCDL